MGLHRGHSGLTVANYIDLEFGDGEYRFALPLAQIDELQRKAGAGIGALFARTLKGANRIANDVVLAPANAEFYALDLIETVRQGLIGGGRGTVDGQEVKVDPSRAQRLVAAYLLNQPLAVAWELAVSILGAVIVGYDPPGEGAPGESPAPSETTTAA